LEAGCDSNVTEALVAYSGAVESGCEADGLDFLVDWGGFGSAIVPGVAFDDGAECCAVGGLF
jgi:hypothetical protein